MFLVERAKTGRAAAATLSPWSLAILTAYVKKLDVEIPPNGVIQEPIRRCILQGYPGRRFPGGPGGLRQGRHTTVGGHAALWRHRGRRWRRLRGRSIEQDGEQHRGQQRLRKTYNPVNVVSVRRFDEARVVGAKKLEQKPDESVREPVLLTLFEKQKSVEG
jgi:hypothetical protein